MAAPLVPGERDVHGSWALSCAAGHLPYLESQPASSCVSELMAKLEKHKAEEEEQESEHSDHGEDPQ